MTMSCHDYMQVLIRALGAGMPTVGRFIVGVIPLFLGYALFGTLLFAEDSARVRIGEFRE